MEKELPAEASKEEFLGITKGIKDPQVKIEKGLEKVEIIGVSEKKGVTEENVCKKCGSKLYADECKIVGYCEICAVLRFPRMNESDKSDKE